MTAARTVAWMIVLTGPIIMSLSLHKEATALVFIAQAIACHGLLVKEGP